MELEVVRVVYLDQQLVQMVLVVLVVLVVEPVQDHQVALL